MKTSDILPSYTSYLYSDELRSLQNEKYTKLVSNDKFGDDGTSTGKNTYTTWYAFERFYSTIDKRFNSKDPVVGNIYEPERVNSYIYAGDNPLIYSDRDGRSFTCDIVNSRIFNKARDLCDTISKAINCFEKTIEPIVKTISKAYECYNRVFEKIPTPVKFGIGLAGAAIACLTGVGTAVVAGALVKSAISGAAFGAAMYGISAIVTGEFNGKDLVSSMINGAADMVMFTGATLGIKGAIECATRNVGKIQEAMLANESGESNVLGKLDEFVERKAGKLEGGSDIPNLTRKQAFNEAKNRAGIPRSQQPVRQWTVGVDISKKGYDLSNYKYNANSGAHGRYYEYETSMGKKVIVEHTNDGVPHFHAGQPKRDADPFTYDFKQDKYLNINIPGKDKHIYYDD